MSAWPASKEAATVAAILNEEKVGREQSRSFFFLFRFCDARRSLFGRATTAFFHFSRLKSSQHFLSRPKAPLRESLSRASLSDTREYTHLCPTHLGIEFRSNKTMRRALATLAKRHQRQSSSSSQFFSLFADDALSPPFLSSSYLSLPVSARGFSKASTSSSASASSSAASQVRQGVLLTKK